jgi:hypothetical protein
MVTRGRLLIHLQKAPQLSKEWGEGQCQALYAEVAALPTHPNLTSARHYSSMLRKGANSS